ncbi:hypothetical protein Y1Q_0002094 [Alligator mississippiensis]|uniref:Uncharacterized protein n=1 Tax=Alligator mississippiensis TaxID=8496 RepID=A0A151MIV9_ALLMI|nr:hypothetical protein Y1Q_0002094 [Alligator mississippiensis]
MLLRLRKITRSVPLLYALIRVKQCSIREATPRYKEHRRESLWQYHLGSGDLGLQSTGHLRFLVGPILPGDVWSSRHCLRACS